LSLLGVASPSQRIHGGVGLDRVRGYTKAPAKSHESGVYDSGRLGYLWRARGSCVPSTDGGIRHGVLRARIQYAITSISPLAAAVLWSGATTLDPLRDLLYGGLRDSV
jgi:hypothetical protein